MNLQNHKKVLIPTNKKSIPVQFIWSTNTPNQSELILWTSSLGHALFDTSAISLYFTNKADITFLEALHSHASLFLWCDDNIYTFLFASHYYLRALSIPVATIMSGNYFMALSGLVNDGGMEETNTNKMDTIKCYTLAQFEVKCDKQSKGRRNTNSPKKDMTSNACKKLYFTQLFPFSLHKGQIYCNERNCQKASNVWNILH